VATNGRIVGVLRGLQDLDGCEHNARRHVTRVKESAGRRRRAMDDTTKTTTETRSFGVHEVPEIREFWRHRGNYLV
jgi:hypothetical protein